MDSKLRLALSSLALLALGTTAFACAGTPIPAPIEGEPVCPDIDIGTAHATKMIGGLTYPVRLRILDGKNVMMKMILSGKRLPGDPSSHTLLPDDNAEYTLEWAQCDNVRAPRPATATAPKTRRPAKDTTAYDCGEARVYKTDKLVTKKHDAGSHAFTFVAPPKADCWAGEVAPVVPPLPAPAPVETTAPSASAVPSASAALPASAAPIAGAPRTPSKAPVANAVPTPINVPAPTK